jgi:hypothetical protein
MIREYLFRLSAMRPTMHCTPTCGDRGEIENQKPGEVQGREACRMVTARRPGDALPVGRQCLGGTRLGFVCCLWAYLSVYTTAHVQGLTA